MFVDNEYELEIPFLQIVEEKFKLLDFPDNLIWDELEIYEIKDNCPYNKVESYYCVTENGDEYLKPRSNADKFLIQGTYKYKIEKDTKG